MTLEEFIDRAAMNEFFKIYIDDDADGGDLVISEAKDELKFTLILPYLNYKIVCFASRNLDTKTCTEIYIREPKKKRKAKK